VRRPLEELLDVLLSRTLSKGGATVAWLDGIDGFLEPGKSLGFAVGMGGGTLVPLEAGVGEFRRAVLAAAAGSDVIGTWRTPEGPIEVEPVALMPELPGDSADLGLQAALRLARQLGQRTIFRMSDGVEIPVIPEEWWPPTEAPGTPGTPGTPAVPDDADDPFQTGASPEAHLDANTA